MARTQIRTLGIADGSVTPIKLSVGGPSWDSSGNLNIGAAGGSSAVNINGYNAYGGLGYYGFLTVTNTNVNLAKYFRLSSTGRFEIVNNAYTSIILGLDDSGNLSVTGDITAYSASDHRLKDNIAPIPDALNKVLSISGNTFDWNEKSDQEGTDVGVIAQEILEVLPEAVTTRDTGYLAVRYEKLVPLLIEAIKEQQEMIANLKNRLETLEGK
jgi:hypothetical protein